MFSVFVCALISLHPFLRTLFAAVPAPESDNSPWYMGCFSASGRPCSPNGPRDLDPVTCCVRCLDEGLLTLPVGHGQGSVALYRTDGPFLHSIRLSYSPNRVQAGKTFVVEVSGNLARPPGQPTGILGLGGPDLFYVMVEIKETTHKGQSSHHVSVSDDGSFVVSCDWILKTPGKYEFSVRVSNPLSTLSSTLHLSVLQPSSHTLKISVLHGPAGVPSCIPFLPTDSSMVPVEAAYLSDPVTLCAVIGGGQAVVFSWRFTHEEKGTNMEGVKTVCPHNSDCLNSSVNWTFETEGVHTVSVNASGAYGWTQETVHIAVVRPIVSDLRVRVSGSQLTSGEDVSVDVELFTTMKQTLVLNLSLSAEYSSTDLKDSISTICGGDFSSDTESFCDDTSVVNDVENHSSKTTNRDINNDPDCTSKSTNISCDRNFSQNHSSIYCRGHFYLGSDAHPHVSNCSSCHLHLHLPCRLPTSAGQYHLTASVLSTSDPSSVLLSAVLPRALTVYERICALRPSASWKSAVSTRAEFSLGVVSSCNSMGSRVVWTFSLDDVIVMSRTTEEWRINVSLTIAGCYNVALKAFNPISWASFCTHILIQDPVGELVLNVPSVITTNRTLPILFRVTAGSNVTVSLLVNATLLYRNSSYTTGEEETVVLLFQQTGPVLVELRAENRVSSQNRSLTVFAEGNRQSSPQVRVNATWQPPTSPVAVHSLADRVQIYAAKQAYPTNTDITFRAVAEDGSGPLEFLWHFGDSRSARTTSRTITKRYGKPGRYDVVVVMSRGQTSLSSDVFPLVVQRTVKLNRLLHLPSVLLNQTVMLSCRVNAGTDLSFLWSFGDGCSRLGQITEQHVFHRTGEFRVTVTVSNLISSASLSSHIFVVERPCQPPPVKNMGPLKLQVRRYEVIRLGVTYEAEVDCDSGGLRYTWTLFDSAGRIFPLPLMDTHKQTLTLLSHLLDYDTYTAIARVQVIDSVVYSNYSVRLQVIPSPPVASIQGGTNVFINNRNATMVYLDGQRSYDPDFPMNPISYSWTCKPVSSITSSCFHQDFPTSSPVLIFPAGYLKRNFDQFHFMLTIHSGGRSASTETFLTLTSNVIGKLSVHCPQCQGDQVYWDQPLSVSTLCEGCDIAPQYIQYTWSLHSVNASSKPVTEVPFCYSVDLSAPSTIMEDPATSPQTLATSTLRSGLTAVAPSSPAHIRTAGTGVEPFYHPLGGLDPPEPLYSSTEYQPLALDNSGVLYPDHLGQRDVISEFPIDSDSSADWEFSFPVSEGHDFGGQADLNFDVPLMSAEEGDPGISAGRPTGVDGESFSPGEAPVLDPELHEGSNLVDSRPSVLIREPILLDLSRDLVDTGLFESYTSTGISSPLLSFRPFSLRPGSRYMIEVTAKSHDRFLGRTQLFLKTSPAPKDMMCQVQPANGTELFTQFSIFCTSGKEDLIYEYSVRVGKRPPRMLYRGRDFHYYFSLPSGEPSDDYKVTISTEIRSSMYGTATRPCPVIVRVQPSFSRDASSSRLDPDLELSVSGLRNLSALLQLGNSVEVRNYVSLLSGILNRLSLDAKVNTQAQRHTRNALIRTMCELESREQASMVDNISILENLLQVTSQVTLLSARRVTLYVQAISEKFSKSTALVWYNLHQKIPSMLVTLLSHSLQTVVTKNDLAPKIFNSDDTERASVSITHEENARNASLPSNGCTQKTCRDVCIKGQRSISTRQAAQLVADILETASHLLLKYILFQEAQELRVSAGLLTVYAAYLNQTSTAISSDSTAVYIPASLIQRLFFRHSREPESRPRPPCVLAVLTRLTHSPYTWARHPGKLSGPVVDLSLYECSARRKIPVHSLIQPINIELQQPPGHSCVSEYVLQRSQVNYHSFSITQEHLQQAIQLSVVFTRPLNRAFPVMLLFRMFERPTPSMHHLRWTHHWKSNATRFTLPSSYLSVAGVGHVALLNADFGKAHGHKRVSEQLSYCLTVDSSWCLSWDGHQGVWTDSSCRTRQTDKVVNCSCHQLRPLTVVQQQIHSSHDAADLDPFLSSASDFTVLGVLVLCVCLYIPSWVACKRADSTSEVNRRVHYLSDNCPHDPYHYAVRIQTGPCSAACMSAKVYIVLNGEDGVSETRELQVPGCTLFRRNAQDTFIVSSADNLGQVWGVQIWHDNSGPSPSWYLKQVEVSEVGRGHVRGRAWLFIGQCWLAVNKGDGRVERMLRVCTSGIGFVKMLRLKLSDYLADHHIWISVHSCPHPNSFTHTQRLGVSLLLLLGYAGVNTAIISQMDHQLPFELGVIDVSALSVVTGVVSVLTVLPAAAMICFLFRLRDVTLTGSGAKRTKDTETENNVFEDALSVTDSTSEPQLSWLSLQQWSQEAWRKKYWATDHLTSSSATTENKNTDQEPVIQTDVVITKEDAPAVKNMVPGRQNVWLFPEGNDVDQEPQGKESDLLSESSRFHGTQRTFLSGTVDGGQTIKKEKGPLGNGKEDSYHQGVRTCHSSGSCVTDWLKGRRFRPVSQWCHYVAWTLCLLLCPSCLVVSAVLGSRFISSKVLLWIHSLFFSLVSCIFLIQPTVIIITAVAVSFWYRNRTDFHGFSSKIKIEMETSQLWGHSGSNQLERTSAFPQEGCSHVEKLLRVRQRARYLRLVCPPTPAQLRKSRKKRRREALLHKTVRDLFICGSMLFLMLCINHSSSFTHHNHLKNAITKQFISRGHDGAFMSIQTYEDWWKWAQTSLLNLLYKNASAATESHILIGAPILKKMEVSSSFHSQVSSVTFIPGSLRFFLSKSKTSTQPQASVLGPVATPPRTCGHLGCDIGPSAIVSLGHMKSDAASKLKLLQSGGWVDRQTAALKVQFTLFCPAPNLFTSVTMLAEQNPTGVLQPSAKVQSVRLYHSPAVWDYIVMLSQLLFLLLSLLQLQEQVHTVWQQGLMGYWRTPCSWLEVSLLTVTLVYYIYYIGHSIIIVDVVELLQRHSHRGHVDISHLATWEQHIRTLRGVTLFLLIMKCATVLGANKTMSTSAVLLTRSLSILLWPTISHLLLMVVLSSIGTLLFVQGSKSFSSLSRSHQTLLCHRWGPRAVRGPQLSWSDFLYHGVLSSTVVWTALVIAVLSSLVRSARRSQSRRNVFTVSQLAGYIRRRVSDFPGKRRKGWTENHMEQKTYYFEEFESLLDELLFRLNALSNCLHHTLPPKAHRYREDSPVILSPIATNMDAQNFVRTQVTEETVMSNPTDISDGGEIPPASHLLRTKLGLEIPQQRVQRGDNSSSGFIAALDNTQQPETRAGKNPKDRHHQSNLKEYLPHRDSAPLIRVWTEDILEKQVGQWTETNDSCRLSKGQVIHREVVVEVLVHKYPGGVEPDKREDF